MSYRPKGDGVEVRVGVVTSALFCTALRGSGGSGGGGGGGDDGSGGLIDSDDYLDKDTVGELVVGWNSDNCLR